MKNSVRQAKIDKQKWLLFERTGRDACGTFDFCHACKHDGKEYPCARAYIKVHRSKEDKE